MKYLLLILTIFLSSLCFAQKQAVFFVTNTGKYVSTKDSADFIRVVKPPDAGSKLYNVFDYYMDGKGKMEAKSHSIYPLRLEGLCTTYYPNGNSKQVAFYKKDYLSGTVSNYLPNGKLGSVKFFSRGDSLSGDKKRVPQVSVITACYDSTGNSTVTAGNGHFISYNDDFNSIAEEGDVKSGKMDGEWKGYDPVYKANFTEVYKDGQMISGRATDDIGTTTYKNRVVEAEYKGGGETLSYFMSRNIRYPAIDREKGIQGGVALMFWISKNGHMNDLRVINKLSPTIDAEAMRVLNLTANSWSPCYKYGRPVYRSNIEAINFYLGSQ